MLESLVAVFGPAHEPSVCGLSELELIVPGSARIAEYVDERAAVVLVDEAR